MDTDDRGFYLQESIRYIIGDEVHHVLIVSLKGLYDNISTLPDGHEYSLRQTVKRVRDSFEPKYMEVLRWVTRKKSISDDLTKWNIDMNRLINKFSRTGELTIPAHEAH